MSEHNLPIDIQLKKLLDWLFSRRICNRQWHQHIVGIREKIGHAIGDMPEHERIKQLLSGTNINYFHCLQIVDILKETEKETKNFFGSYGSQRMKDWQEVVRLYEKENIFLAEAAQLLSQAISYEIPGLKKALAKSIQVQEECDKKEKDNARKAKEFRNEFVKACKQLGIEGVKIRREIIQLLDELPRMYFEIAEDSKKLTRARQVYRDFLKTTLKFEFCKESELLPTLSFLIERGNKTTYEWVHGEAPLSIEEPEIQIEDEDDDDKADKQDTIDFGDESVDFGTSGDNDFDSGNNIDWGNLDTVQSEEAQVEIDWGHDDVVNNALQDIVVEGGGVSGGVARDAEALTILDNRRTRTAILDDLTELQCFLEQRLVEVKSIDEGSGFTLASGERLKDESRLALSGFVADISSITSRLTSGKIHHLQLIRSSPKYVDRLVDSLKMKLVLEQKMVVANKVLNERRNAAIQEQASLQTQLKVLRQKSEELQRHIEKDISKRYQNRQVNIIGGVQAV